MNNKICPKCQTHHNKVGIFCSRTCANSRGPRSDEFKKKVSDKLSGRTWATQESIRKGILSRGRTPSEDKPNTICVICKNSTNTKHRKTCSPTCYSKLLKLQSQQHPNCGGQKRTHRSKIYNNKNEMYVSESSFEVRLSEILNLLNVYWVRPEHIWYTDSKGDKRRYFPDFYLPDHDLYIDPKNDFLIKTDIDKINRAAKENNILIIVLGDNHITIDSVKSLVGDRGTAPLHPACKAGTLLLS